MSRRSAATLASASLLGLSLLLCPERAHAEPDAAAKSLSWNPAWPRFRPVEYAATGVIGGAALTAFFVLKARREPSFSGGILLDDEARDALRLRSPTARDRARKFSDLTALSALLVLSIDSMLIPTARGSTDVAEQLTLMDLEAFATSTLITASLVKAIGRARPSYADCQANPNFDPLCDSGPTASLPSGHASTAFTAAGLSCAHHSHLALYGDPVADALGCGFALVLATTTATLRVLGDRHYLSDVAMGSAVGFGVGYAAPLLFHYTAGESTSVSAGSGTAAYGLSFSGTF